MWTWYLPYILLQMVCASYCAPYPKWPCVKHKANMWCLCCMTLFCSRTFYFLLLSSVINVVTIPSDVTDVTVWQITSNPDPIVLKIENMKINWNENENKKRKENNKELSPLLIILTHIVAIWLIYFLISLSRLFLTSLNSFRL